MTDSAPGPTERHFETIEFLPGLSNPEAACSISLELEWTRPHL